jgi:hypothetical protein
MSRNSKILALAILICANIAALTYIRLRGTTASSQPTATTKAPDVLPAYELVDDGGRRLQLNELTGRVLLVQFVNPAVVAQINAVSKVASAFGADQVSLLLITRDSQELRARAPDLSEDVLIVQRDYAKLKEVFSVPECCERRFIFNGKGELLYKDYYEANLSPRLHALIGTKTQDFPAALVGALESITEGRFASLRELTRRSRSGKAVVIIFDSVCTSCASGELVKSANRFAAAHQEIPLFAILPKDYTAGDLENFKANLRVKFSAEVADSALTERWLKLSGVYGESRTNGSVVLVERGSVIPLKDLAEAEQPLSRF